MKMQQINKEFPFTEWRGLLTNRSKNPRQKYPTLDWIEKLKDKLTGITLSGHVCGIWGRQICKGKYPEALANMDGSGKLFKRMQLNVSKVTDIDPGAMCKYLRKNREYIIQIGREEGKVLTLARTLHCKISDTR